MNPISSQTYEDETDLQIIFDLIARVRPVTHLHDYPAKMDIEENLASDVVCKNTRLWFDHEQPVAWAYVDEFHNLWWELDSAYEEILGAEIIAWGESCIRKTLANGGTSTLDTSCRDDYVEKISFLERYEFSRTEDATIAMTRPLDEPIPEAILPDGFVIRPILGTQEADAVASTHRAAFGTDYMTTENRLIIMTTSEYDPSLDLVVVAPDGMIAAYCTCSVNLQERTGRTDPVAVHPKYQGRGLASALLLTGMRLLKERGMTSAQLGTSAKNTAMQKTAKAVGFTEKHRTIWFAKQVN